MAKLRPYLVANRIRGLHHTKTELPPWCVYNFLLLAEHQILYVLETKF